MYNLWLAWYWDALFLTRRLTHRLAGESNNTTAVQEGYGYRLGPVGGAAPAAARESRMGKRYGAIMRRARVRMEPWGIPRTRCTLNAMMARPRSGFGFMDSLSCVWPLAPDSSCGLDWFGCMCLSYLIVNTLSQNREKKGILFLLYLHVDFYQTFRPFIGLYLKREREKKEFLFLLCLRFYLHMIYYIHHGRRRGLNCWPRVS